MFKLKLKFFLLAIHFLFTTFGFAHEQIIRVNGLDIWCESFGNPKHPALLLIMGGGCQGIMWPKDFCQQLSEKEFFVIRYDHRDIGLSSGVDFNQNPYDLGDLAKDAIGILDYFQIEKAYIVGSSMGGAIAQLIGVHYPQRAHTLILMSTSSDLSITLDSFEGKPNPSTLSKPSEKYVKWAQTIIANKAETIEQKLDQDLEGWKVLNGSIVEFDEKLYRDLLALQFKRLNHPEGISHQLLAMRSSSEKIKQAGGFIHIPTIIIHGTEDPIFPLDHGQALSHLINGSKLLVINGMGHILNPHFYDQIIDCIKEARDENQHSSYSHDDVID